MAFDALSRFMSLKQLFLLVLLAALWGASFLFMRIAVPEFGPFALIAVRVGIASLVLLPIWWIAEPLSQRQLILKAVPQMVTLGVLNSAIPFVLFAYSTLHITGGLASIMNSTATIWTAIVAWLWLGRKPSLQVSIGLGLGLLGVVLLVSDAMMGGVWETNMQRGYGAMAAALAAILYGVAANYAAERIKGLSTLTIATFSLVTATVALIPIALIYVPIETISTKAWLAVIMMAVFCTAAANIIYFYLLKNVGPTRAVSVTFLIPVFGTLWGVLFINEPVSFGMLFGGVVILLGIAMVTQLIRYPGSCRT